MIQFTCSNCHKQVAAEDQHIGTQVSCPHCTAVLVVPRSGVAANSPPAFSQTPSTPKASGKAVASIILGFLSFCFSIFTGIPAIILGIIAMKEVKNSRGTIGGHGLALTGVITGSVGSALAFVFIAIGMLLPALSMVREKAHRSNCEMQARQIGIALKEYAIADEDNQKFPPNLQTLVDKGFITDIKLFRDPSSHDFVGSPTDVDSWSDYVLEPSATKDDGSSDTILLYCKGHYMSRRTAGRNVVFVDGHVAWMLEEVFQLLLENQQAQFSKQNP